MRQSRDLITAIAEFAAGALRRERPFDDPSANASRLLMPIRRGLYESSARRNVDWAPTFTRR